MRTVSKGCFSWVTKWGFSRWLVLLILLSWLAIFMKEWNREWRRFQKSQGLDATILEEPPNGGTSRVDRCRTCHDFGAGECSFTMDKVHKNMDSRSIISGCTVCHGGCGESTGFVSAGHLASSESEQERWTELYGNTSSISADKPIVSRTFSESGCYFCHPEMSALIPVPQRPTGAASNLLRGARLIREYRCAGCHGVETTDGTEVPLPDAGRSVPLNRLGDRMDSESIQAYLISPSMENPHAKMPQLFGQPTDSSQEIDDVRTIATWLATPRSTDGEPPFREPNQALPSADPKRGKIAFVQYGCAACHVNRELFTTLNLLLPGPGLSDLSRRFTATQSKMWVYEYISNPSHYFANSRMPKTNFQSNLPSGSNDPVADIVAFLFEDTEKRVENRSTNNKLLINTTNRDPIDLISQYGCAGCHEIPGTHQNRIGPSLATVGQKSIHQFDFGQVKSVSEWNSSKLDETMFVRWAVGEKRRDGFLWAKILSPRALQNPEFPSLKMGEFRTLTPTDRRDIVTFLLGLRGEKPTISISDSTVCKRRIIAETEDIFHCYGCRSCHEILPEYREILPFGSSKTQWIPGISELEHNGNYRKIPNESDRLSVVFHPWETVAMPDENLIAGEGSVLIPTDRPYLASDGGDLTRLFATTLPTPRHSEDSRTPRERTAPSLFRVGERIQPSWLERWLLNPTPYRPNLALRMPNFPLSPNEARSLVEFFHLMANASPTDGAPDETGENTFTFAADEPTPTNPLFNATPGTEEYLELLNRQEITKKIILSSANCVRCHDYANKRTQSSPAMGPELRTAVLRLRPAALKRWIATPQRIRPTTSMPALFQTPSQVDDVAEFLLRDAQNHSSDP